VSAPSAAATIPSAAPPGRRRAALALLVSAQFVVMLDTSIVNVALPSIQADLALGATGLTWVVNAYVLAFGGLLLLAGRTADLLGRRRVLVAGAVVFTLGTLVAGTAASPTALVLGRVVQGVGAAALSPAAMSLLLVTFPGRARARAMSMWGAASTAGGATGVVAGGLLAEHLGWSSVFFVTVPITALAAVAALRLLDPAPGRPGRRWDGTGAAAITGAVVALVHAALAVPQHGWRSPTVLVAVGAAGALLVTFVAVERRVRDPLVPLAVFRSRPVSTGTVLAVLGGAARASTFVLVALYLQQGLHLAPAAAGLAMVPTSLAGLAVSLSLLPRVLRVLGPERSLVTGLLVLAAGHLWLARTPAAALYAVDVLPGLLLVATGVALSFTPTTMVLASGLPAEHAGLASGLSGAGTQVGAALGTAGFTAAATAATVTAATVGDGAAMIGIDGFAAAFGSAACVALVTAAVGLSLVDRRPRTSR
jgi:EmrB/QacA subfamily drug resistance transporter